MNKRQEILQSAIEGKLRVQDKASERLQDQIIQEIKELESTKKLQGVTSAPPRDLTNWLEARKLENGEWRLEPEGEAEVRGIIVVSDAVEGTFVDLDGESRSEQVEARLSRRERSTERRG